MNQLKKKVGFYRYEVSDREPVIMHSVQRIMERLKFARLTAITSSTATQRST